MFLLSVSVGGENSGEDNEQMDVGICLVCFDVEKDRSIAKR